MMGAHGVDAKMRKVQELSREVSKVKLTVRFRGREAVHQQLGLSVLKKVADDLKDNVRLEKPPSMEGRSLSMILMPTAARNEKTEEKTAEKPEEKVKDQAKKKAEDLADAKA